MNKFLVVFTTTTTMVLLFCSNNTLCKDAEVDFTLPVFADFTLQFPTSSGLPLTLDVVASSVVSLQAKSKISLPVILKDVNEEQTNKSCPINITPQRLDNTDTVGATFPPVNIITLGGNDTIVEGKPVSIQFANMHNCTGSPVWQVVNGVVQTGGNLGKDKFKIKRVVDEESAGINGPVYKIQSCPNNNSVSCKDLGLSLDLVTASIIVTTTQNSQTSPLHVQIKPNN